jgi:hypothetical protein
MDEWHSHVGSEDHLMNSVKGKSLDDPNLTPEQKAILTNLAIRKLIKLNICDLCKARTLGHGNLIHNVGCLLNDEKGRDLEKHMRQLEQQYGDRKPESFADCKDILKKMILKNNVKKIYEQPLKANVKKVAHTI